MDFQELVNRIGEAMELLGIGVLVVGIGLSLLRFGVALVSRHDDAYVRARQAIGRSILLGLEILVAGDIIRTVAVSPTFTTVGVLAAIVAIRTFLSFTLEMEISGSWPWQTDDGGGR